MTTPGSFKGYIRKMLTGPYVNNFRAGFIYIDEFYETKSSGAITPTIVKAI